MRVVWTLAAERSRAGVLRYIAADNPSAADRMDELFDTAAGRLAKFPSVGRPGRIPGTRELVPHKNYVLIYDIVEDTVRILNLVHTSRQWPPSD